MNDFLEEELDNKYKIMHIYDLREYLSVEPNCNLFSKLKFTKKEEETRHGIKIIVRDVVKPIFKNEVKSRKDKGRDSVI